MEIFIGLILIIIFFSFNVRYELIDSAEQRFTIKQGIAGGFWLSTTSKMIDYEERSNYSIIIRTTDNGIPALSYQQQIVIQVRILSHCKILPFTISISKNNEI